MSAPEDFARAAVAGRILVVDDHEPNRQLLQEILQLEGHEVILGESGGDAVSHATGSRPDLILLDVNMPGMDGFEVCRRLRADPATASLPIILVTSFSQREQRLEGIAAGANDYLNKPIDRADLLLRVRNALRLRKLHQELMRQYETLKRMESLRDSLVHMLVHDLRSPLTGITGYLDLLKLDPVAAGDPTLLSYIDGMDESAKRLVEMVNTVLDVNRFEAHAMPLARRRTDLSLVLGEALAAMGATAGAERVRVTVPEKPVDITADPDIIRRVIVNLVANALKFTPSQGEVRVEVERTTRGAEVRIHDSGPGIPPEHHELIFEKFGQVGGAHHAGVRSTGLGLTFCKLAVEAHEGRIGLTSAMGKGSTFWFALPVAD
ncbi:MAG: response regulator [Gemmatimonadales bacterium]|nr:response regulator [Gemmatimonadales bacterium]